MKENKINGLLRQKLMNIAIPFYNYPKVIQDNLLKINSDWTLFNSFSLLLNYELLEVKGLLTEEMGEFFIPYLLGE